jgi:hypothetical protein
LSSSINPGNSGGPLITRDGAVVGINDAGMARYPGLGFAVPMRLAWPSAARMLSRQQQAYSWFGAYVRETGRELQEEMDIPSETTDGLLVIATALGSPAQKAGLRFRDVLLAMDGEALRTYNDLANLMVAKRPGDDSMVKVRRGESNLILNCALVERPSIPRFALDDFTRLFLRCEWRCVTNDTNADPTTNLYQWSVARSYVPEAQKAKFFFTNRLAVWGFSPGHPYAHSESTTGGLPFTFPEPLQGPDHVEDLLNRCWVADDTAVAFSLMVPMSVPLAQTLNLPAGFQVPEALQRNIIQLRWANFEVSAHQRGY